MILLTEKQREVMRDTYKCMVDSYKAKRAMNYFTHDWEKHRFMIDQLEKVFGDIISPIDTGD